MVKYTDAQGNTTNLDRKGFMALMKNLWEVAQANKAQEKEVEDNA